MGHNPSIREFIDAAAERAKQIQEPARSLLRSAEEITEIQAAASLNEDGSEQFLRDAEAIEDKLLTLRRSANDIYQTIAEPETYHGQRSYSEALSSNEQEKYRSIFSVKATASGREILIKMPLLPSRFGRRFRTKPTYENNKFWGWYDKFFDIELKAALAKIEPNIPYALRYNLTFLHVNPTSKSNLADADNYDTKHVIDVVTDFICGTDAPECCSVTTFTLGHGPLDKGTYLYVNPRYKNPPSLYSILVAFMTAEPFQFSNENEK